MLNTSHTNMHLLDALNDNGVEYMVVGGLAVRFYCPERTVRDLDLLVNPATDNARKAIEALTYLLVQEPGWCRVMKSALVNDGFLADTRAMKSVCA